MELFQFFKDLLAHGPKLRWALFFAIVLALAIPDETLLSLGVLAERYEYAAPLIGSFVLLAFWNLADVAAQIWPILQRLTSRAAFRWRFARLPIEQKLIVAILLSWNETSFAAPTANAHVQQLVDKGFLDPYRRLGFGYFVFYLGHRIRNDLVRYRGAIRRHLRTADKALVEEISKKMKLWQTKNNNYI